MQILVVVALIQKANCRHWVRYSGGPLGVKEVFVRKLRGSVRGCSLDIYLFGFHIYLEHLKRLTFFQDRVWPSTRSCSNRDDWKTLCLVQPAASSSTTVPSETTVSRRGRLVWELPSRVKAYVWDDQWKEESFLVLENVRTDKTKLAFMDYHQVL